MQKVYLDNAATTPMLNEVSEAMIDYIKQNKFGNPSGQYELGFSAKGIVNSDRIILANTIGAKPDQIYFTSGGSEGDNWIIKGVAALNPGKHIITTSIEHKAVLNACHFLEKFGYQVTYVDPDERGFIHPSDIENAIRPDTVLVSVMFANNEIGTIQPIDHIASICRKHNVLFHTDAVQAYCHMPINIAKYDVDFLTVSSHKFHGPGGIGFAYIKDPNTVDKLIHGGQQEHGMRGGTENVLGIVGMAKAAEIAHRNLTDNINQMTSLRDYFIERVLNEIPHSHLNGSLVNRLCNNVSFGFDGVPGEAAIAALDMRGISCSSGSACNSEANTPSHVLTAIGRLPEYARTTLRFTISELTTMDQVNYAIDQLKLIVGDLRSIYGKGVN